MTSTTQGNNAMKTLWILAAAATITACASRSDEEVGAAPDRGDTTAVTTEVDTTTGQWDTTGATGDINAEPSDTGFAPTTPDTAVGQYPDTGMDTTGYGTGVDTTGYGTGVDTTGYESGMGTDTTMTTPDTGGYAPDTGADTSGWDSGMGTDTTTADPSDPTSQPTQ